MCICRRMRNRLLVLEMLSNDNIIKRRFLALAYGLRVHVETAQKIISVAMMLHNICIDFNELEPPVEADLENILRDQVNNVYLIRGIEAANVRRVRRNARDEILELFHTRI